MMDFINIYKLNYEISGSDLISYQKSYQVPWVIC